MKPALIVWLSIAAMALALVYALSTRADADELSDWYASQYLCHMGETPTGRELSTDEESKACDQREKLASELVADGYCFDTSEREWAKHCPIVAH